LPTFETGFSFARTDFVWNCFAIVVFGTSGHAPCNVVLCAGGALEGGELEDGTGPAPGAASGVPSTVEEQADAASSAADASVS
jgi:hypothetical protein